MSIRKGLLLTAALLAPLGSGGCLGLSGVFNPFTMGAATPIPVAPWTGERIEEKYLHKNDFRTPVMPPIREGFPPPLCEDEPSDREVLRAMRRVARGVPYVYEEFRDNVEIVKERIVDKIDPPRFFPLVGPAQLHHCHWKCTIYFVETQQSDYPFPVKIKKNRVEVIYIDKDHLHMCVPNNPEVQQQITREFTNY